MHYLTFNSSPTPLPSFNRDIPFERITPIGAATRDSRIENYTKNTLAIIGQKAAKFFFFKPNLFKKTVRLCSNSAQNTYFSPLETSSSAKCSMPTRCSDEKINIFG